MAETLEKLAMVAAMVVAVLVGGTGLVWLVGQMGRLLERPARWLGRYWYPGDIEDAEQDGE